MKLINKKSIILTFLVGLSFFSVFSIFLNNDFNPIINNSPSSPSTPLISAEESFSLQGNEYWGNNDVDQGEGVAIDSSGNIYVAGYTDTLPAVGKNDEILLVKFNNTRHYQWNVTWGGSSEEYGKDVAIDSSGNIYVVGHTSSFAVGLSDICLIKYNNEGIQQWNRTWGGASEDYGESIAIDSQDNVFIVGITSSFGALLTDICIMKYNKTGAMINNVTWGGAQFEEAHGVAIDSNDDVYVCGKQGSMAAPFRDMCLLKYNNSLSFVWQETVGEGEIHSGNDVAIDSKDDIYVSGTWEDSSTHARNISLWKYNGSGIQEFNVTWAGVGNDTGNGVAIDSFDDVYITGTTTSFGNGLQKCTIRFNGSGSQEWNATWGGAQSENGLSVAVDPLNDIFVAGYSQVSGIWRLSLVHYGYDMPRQFLLGSDASNPDNDGNFNLTWSLSKRANNYTVYRYGSKISEINGTITELGSDITSLTYSISGYLNGTYFFIVVAFNNFGNLSSNCIKISVIIPLTSSATTTTTTTPSPYGVPGYSIITLLLTLSVISVILVKKQLKNHK